MLSAIILAAGKGSRLNLGYNKIFYEIKNKAIIEYSVDYFLNDDAFSEVIVVVNEKDRQRIKEIFKGKDIKIVLGGITRQESVHNALKKTKGKYVLIHDGARPYIDKKDIENVKTTVIQNACVLATSIKDSLAQVKFKKIHKYINRNDFVALQTPQAFETSKILKAYDLADVNNNIYSDDASLYMQETQDDVIMLEGNELNLKLTTELDLKILEEIL
jgi:2-C-methyl-D-erythritol 4-phosphate cytidylyltransferase